MISKNVIKALVAALTNLPFTASYVNAESAQHTVILANTPRMVRWAVIQQQPDIAHNDPYYHLEVFEHKKGDKPWVFKRFAHHMVITPEALANSRNDSHAQTYAYKDVEFRMTYKQWRDNRETRAQTPVCKTSIKDCLERATDEK